MQLITNIGHCTSKNGLVKVYNNYNWSKLKGPSTLPRNNLSIEEGQSNSPQHIYTSQTLHSYRKNSWVLGAGAHYKETHSTTSTDSPSRSETKG